MQLLFINKNNEELDLLNNQQLFALTAVEGLHGIATEFAETDSPYMDGTQVENVRALPRGIALQLTLQRNVQAAIDLITSIAKSKQVATLRETDRNGREIEIQGRVTIDPYTRLSNKVVMTINLYCPQPYWQDVQEIIGVISEIIDLLYFPQPIVGGIEGRAFPEVGIPFGEIDTNKTKVFTNEGDTSVGMTLSIVALDEVVNPKISCSSGTQNGWWMQLGSQSIPFIMNSGDEVIISTHRGNKYILYNNRSLYNGNPILNYFHFNGKDWLQLETGDNEFVIDTDEIDSNVYFNVFYKRKYE